MFRAHLLAKLAPPSPSKTHLKPPLSPSSQLAQSLARTYSAPSVLGSDVGLCTLPWHGTVKAAERHRQHVASSPQGLFARTTPPEAFGSVCCHRFNKLPMQEKRAQSTSKLSKRARAPAEETQEVSNLRELQEMKDLFDIREGLRVAILNQRPSPLGTEKVWPPSLEDRAAVTFEEVTKVYQVFCGLLDIEDRTYGGDVGAHHVEGGHTSEFFAVLDRSASSTFGAELQSLEGIELLVTHVGTKGQLATWNEQNMDNAVWKGDRIIAVNGVRGNPSRMIDEVVLGDGLVELLVERMHNQSGAFYPISWPTFFDWFEAKMNFAPNVRLKATFRYSLHAMKAWLKYQATDAQRHHGMSFTSLLRWMWPFVSSSSLEEMLTKLCLVELEKYRQPTPPVSAGDAMKRFDRVFLEMDWRARGSLIPADLAGGEFQTANQLQKQLIDEHSVKSILGDRSVEWAEFLEIMCEDDFRGHEESTHAIMKDGRHLVRHIRDTVGFHGWVLRDMPPEEVPLRRRVAALETEVLRWRHAVAAETAPEGEIGDAQQAVIQRAPSTAAPHLVKLRSEDGMSTMSTSMGSPTATAGASRNWGRKKSLMPTDHDFAVDHLSS